MLTCLFVLKKTSTPRNKITEHSINYNLLFPANLVNSDMWTPLHLACVQGHHSIASMLVDAGADPDSRDRSDLSVVQRLSRQLHELAKLKTAAELRVSAWSNASAGAGAGVAGAGGAGGSKSSHRAGAGERGLLPTIMSAPLLQHTTRIDVLADRLKEVQKVLLGPQQRLEEAVRTRNVRIVESLIGSSDIEPDATLPEEGHGRGTPDPTAVGEHNGFDSEPTLLHWTEMDAQLARCLLSHGATVDAMGAAIATPLHKAAERGAVELVQVLLEYQADINAQQSLGQSPLHLAALGGHMEVIDLLRSEGASLTLEDEDGDTPFHSASSLIVMDRLAVGPQCLGVALLAGRDDAVAMLLRVEGCDVDAMCIKNKTALHLACQVGATAVVMDLLELGASVQVVGGSYLCTPLHYAASEGHRSICQLLMTSHADLNAKDLDQKRPFDLAEDESLKQLLRPRHRVSAINVPRNTAALQAPFLPGAGADAEDADADVDVDDGLCKICLTAPIETILLPCGHQAFCFSCANRITDCALCRQSITEIMRVFRVE